MKVRINSKNKTKSLLIAESEDDSKVLQFLYDNKTMWGFYKLIVISDKNIHLEEVKALANAFPNCKAVAYLSQPQGYVNPYEREKIA